MHGPLIKYINNFGSRPLSESEIEVIKTIFVPIHLKKKQVFLAEGDVCKHFAFIVKGAMRQFSIDEKGIQHTVQLSIESWWVGDRESFLMLTPSIYYIDTAEDTDVLLISKSDLVTISEQIPVFYEMRAKLDERSYFATQKRLNSSISLSAEKRFENFANTFPNFLQRFPQQIIASYLGITKETLSRIRKKLLKK